MKAIKFAAMADGDKNSSSNNDDDDENQICFVVTGFGPFRGMKDNPTTTIANMLAQYIMEQQHDADWATGYLIIEKTLVMETSAEAAQQETDSLVRDLLSKTTKSKKIVLLHLGVDYQAENVVALEQCAYNEANFRIPDEKGFQPRNAPVLGGCDDEILRTRIDLETVCRVVNNIDDGDSQNNNNSVVISTDPGRFVCNYTYFCSLQKFQEYEDVFPLFMHVPTFSKIPQQKQLEMITSIMAAIRNEIKKQA
eukprot:CAMPEP_0194251018 /NCGR_PEP_ID=MMETSP0158-20130606/24418_1 /TAXON_ID=33649 /ORGANISM="Thalassionema nitzschioides, Strain L26-B" /LENGTH=251 /DNA_ID=CAMNT_0038988013 /DNA_START=1 /DNA_END=756 /DNA_ORIENTATION=+